MAGAYSLYVTVIARRRIGQRLLNFQARLSIKGKGGALNELLR